MKKDFWSEEELEQEPDVYCMELLGNQCEDDALDPEDAAFMAGYLAA